MTIFGNLFWNKYFNDVTSFDHFVLLTSRIGLRKTQ